ncbi:hypothetical protein ACHAWF_010098 [Thalassiosira exigua]
MTALPPLFFAALLLLLGASSPALARDRPGPSSSRDGAAGGGDDKTPWGELGLEGDKADASAKLVAWIAAEHPAMLHPSAALRPVDPDDPTSRLGLFATASVAPGEVLMTIPPELTTLREYLPADEDGPDNLPCRLVRTFLDELAGGAESPYFPYFEYLRATKPATPSSWSWAGMDLLEKVLKDHGHGYGAQLFPPAYPVDWLEDDYARCQGGERYVGHAEKFAASWVVQNVVSEYVEGEGEHGGYHADVLPVYDLIAHRGYYSREKNAELTDIIRKKKGGNTAVVKSTRAIEEGEEIFAPTCHKEHLMVINEDLMPMYATPDRFRDCGIVEGYPQTWHFRSGADLAFEVDYADDDTGHLAVSEWMGEHPPNQRQMSALRDLLSRLTHAKESILSTPDRHPSHSTVPRVEFDAISSYVAAMEAAMIVALRQGDETCEDAATCSLRSFGTRYKSLDDVEHTLYYDDGEGDPPTCDERITMAPYSDGTFEDVEVIESPYQTLEYVHDESQRNTCLRLDSVIQICDSYRPHYHEMSVHTASRYIEDPKRFLWVGGGDSMLLHEFLKYPNLELAVGLELDQRVTRSAFQHFGARPHFDHPKVQWWYGDATKSLVMLPQEYFGSFDLVVVDLSETVMSFQVTGGLNIMESLTLLLKEDGIFVKNEVYFGEFKKMFPQSVQVHWYDNPFVCSQVMVMGSRGIDFMNPELTDHGVDGHLIHRWRNTDDPYHLYHDFGRNDSPLAVCDTAMDQKEEAEQTSSPGILLILEAEGASVDLADPSNLKDAVANSLTKEGFAVESSIISVSPDGNHIVLFVLKEGYIVARAMAKHKYCGFDLHFWSGLEKQERAKDALVAAVGADSSSTSVYRIIAGGMFGVSTWEEDKKLRGPQFESICSKLREENEKKESRKKAKDGKGSGAEGLQKDHVIIAGDALAESVSSLVDGEHKKIAMLVGDGAEVGLGDEKTKERIESLEDVDQVHLLNCPGMHNFNEFLKDAMDTALACETQLKAALQGLSREKKFDVLIIGSSANKHTSSILLKVFASQYNSIHPSAFEQNILVVSTSPTPGSNAQQWLGPFVQLFKVDAFIHEPATYSEIAILSGGATKVGIKLQLANNRDEHFLRRLNNTMVALQERTGYDVEYQMVDGGRYIMQEHFNPSRVYRPDDYDQTGPLTQWKSQQPTGHQIIFQMEPNGKQTKPLSLDTVRSHLQRAILRTGFEGLSIDMIEDEIETPGDGYLLGAFWPGGSIVVLWDGRNHVDINLFTYQQDKKKADEFDNTFRMGSGLKTVLRDEQPRGIGKVVSYFSDIENNGTPRWA